MNRSGSLTRRAVIASTIAAQFIPGIALGTPAAPAASGELLIVACLAFGCAKRMGNACERALEAESLAETALIFDALRAACHDCSSIDAVHCALREQSRDDFRRGRTLVVDGWLLSLTEVRAYALATKFS